MKGLLGIIKSKSFFQMIGVSALCALIWYAGPWVAIAGKVPLQPEFNRLLVICGIVVVWVLILLFGQARAQKAEQQLISDLAAPVIDPEEEAISKAQDEEAHEVQRKFEEALHKLKRAQGRGKRDKRYLYELPWYIIIGAPGSGKTTALLNSGLTFPLSDRLDQNAVQGIGGTRNCDWLFADEAIFVDTAGRYTSQDSYRPVDESAWKGFLNLLKKHRQQRPINGVLVTMSMSDLLDRDENVRNQHALNVRQRIQELYSVLNVRFPVYMLFTKCDLVSGFNDFFADLNSEKRAQVWGHTFPGSDSGSLGDQLLSFEGGFDEILQRLNQRTIRRIQEERDIQRRGRILDFPQQLALLKMPLVRFLTDAFASSRYDTEPLVRGIYFTSGTQEGTPIDRVMGRLAETYGIDRQKQAVFSGRGKAFFITRLLKEVIIPEGERTGVDPAIERRRRMLQWTVYGCLAALVLGMTALWTVSYTRNKRAMAEVNQQIERYRTIRKEASARDRDGIISLLVKLETLKAAHDVYENHTGWMGLGLYQGEKIQSEIDRVYIAQLSSGLLPLIQHRLEQRLRLGTQTTKPEDMANLYELLQAYLMLGQPDKLETKKVGMVIAKEWGRSFAREPKVQAALITHTDQLLSEENWLDPIALNKALVDGARRRLNSIPLSSQLYTHLKSDAATDSSHNYRVSENLGRYGDRVFDEKSTQTQSIPALFTRYGYTTFFREQGLEAVKKALSQNWILENPAADQATDLNRIYDDLEKLYFAEYEKRWRNLLDGLRIKRAQNFNETIQLLDVLSSPDTPIRPLLESVESNTALSKADEPPTDSDKQGQEVGEGKTDSGLIATLQHAPVPVPLRRMEQHFRDLNLLVQTTDGSPAPLDNVLNRLAGLRDGMMLIGNSAKSEEQALKMARERMSGGGSTDSIKLAQLEFSRLPEPLKSWFLSLTSFGWKLTLNSAKSELNSIWRQEVVTPYQSGLDNRYPLFANSLYDATLADFSRFFSPGGTMDTFFQSHIRPFVDTSRNPWRQVAMDNQGMGLSRSVLRQFQNAAKIRQTFFATGGQSPSVDFELRPIELDAALASFRLDIEGQNLTYSHGPIRSTRFHWPGQQPDLGVRLTFQTIEGRQINDVADGPWALFRILDRARVDATLVPDRFRVTFAKSGYHARFELRASSSDNPFQLKELKQFRCPGAM